METLGLGRTSRSGSKALGRASSAHDPRTLRLTANAGPTKCRLLAVRDLSYTDSMKIALATLVAVSVIGCGSPPPANPASTTGSEEHGKHKGEHGDHHAELPPALKDFHGVIKPVWHTDAGAKRVEKACASAKAMVEKATATNDAALVTASKDLDAACAKDGKPDVEAKLTAVHDRFHALAKHEEKHEEKH